jgi:hypothetical protein
MSLDKSSLDKIIEAVGKKFVPAGLDWSALRRAIDDSEKSAELIAVHRRGARARKLLKRLKQVRETAELLAVMLDTKDDASDLIQELCGEWPKAMVSRLIVNVEALEQVISDGKPSQWGNPNANEWLAGVELPCVFEEHFHRKPGGSRNEARKAGGPCVRFIEATMRELGKPYDPASVLRAMTRLRALQASRSLVRQTRLADPELEKTDQ